MNKKVIQIAILSLLVLTGCASTNNTSVEELEQRNQEELRSIHENNPNIPL